MLRLLLKTIFIFIAAFLPLLSFSQDTHYSQFYSSPLTLNPALTGVNDCSYRISAMYRNQWKSVTDPYQTPSISFDINNLFPKVFKKGSLSAGALVLNDKAGSGSLTNLSFMGSLAYQLPLANDRFMISFGVQGGYVQQRLDFSKLTFEEQFNGQIIDPSLSNMENYKSKISYGDFNAGIYLSYKASEQVDIFGGGAQFHLTQPKESFLSDASNQLPMRTVIHGGLRIGASAKVNLIPQVLFMTQDKAQETNVGISADYKIKPETDLYIGVYDRLKDAIIPEVGFQIQKFKLGMSYDVNTSTLQPFSHGAGGFEISLSYVGCLGGIIFDKPVMFCPRF